MAVLSRALDPWRPEQRKAAQTQLLPGSELGAGELSNVHLEVFREQTTFWADPPGGSRPGCLPRRWL